MQYLEALRFLHSRDDWERSGSARDSSRWDLGRMRSLLGRVDGPQQGRVTVHVAGSKGKGSTAAMIASVLKATGAKTGLYTSPHLHRFTERIAVDGQPVTPEDFGRLMGELAPHLEAEESAGDFGPVSTFEALTALAFLAFKEREADAQVLEVGLGGRLDATNVVEGKEVCVITPIGLEHTAVLGETVAQIAGEKAGIISKSTTVVMAPQRESAADVIRQTCAEQGATLIEVAEACSLRRISGGGDGQEFALRTPVGTYRLRVPLAGAHQLENAASAVLALEALAPHGIEVSETALREGLDTLRWPARIETLRRRPLIVADGAHDRDSARRLAQTMREDLGRSKAILIFGCHVDKDVEAIWEELAPLATEALVTRSRHPRAMDPSAAMRPLIEREVPATIMEPVGAALDAALAGAGAGDAVLVCGSLLVAAEAREHLLGIAYDPPPDDASPRGTLGNEVKV